MRVTSNLFIIFAVVIVSGCGGGGSSSSPATTPTPTPTPSASPTPTPSPTPSQSPFTGSFVGIFNTTNPQSGTLNVTVGTDGTLTGSGHNNTTLQNFTISGTVSNTGSTNITFTYPSFTASASGTVAFSNSTTVLGTLTQSSGGSVTISIVKQ